MDDMISRRSVLALPRNRIRNMRGEIVEESINVADIETLPSAQPIDVQEAYYRGKIDGIKECTTRLKKMNDEFAKEVHDEID